MCFSKFSVIWAILKIIIIITRNQETVKEDISIISNLDELMEMPEKFPRKTQVNIEIGPLNREMCQRLAAQLRIFSEGCLEH